MAAPGPMARHTSMIAYFDSGLDMDVKIVKVLKWY
jgi:hypothetical protein